MARPSDGRAYHAVAIGKHGAKIYNTRAEAEEATRDFRGGSYESFHTLQEAVAWLGREAFGVNLFERTGVLDSSTVPASSNRRHRSSSPTAFASNSGLFTPSSNPRSSQRYLPYPTLQRTQTSIHTTHSPTLRLRGAPTHPLAGAPATAEDPIVINSDEEEDDDDNAIELVRNTATAASSRVRVKPEPADPDVVGAAGPASVTGDGAAVNVKAEEGDANLIDGLLLAPEQQQILHRVLNGESIFFTGAAGVGKSSLLKAIIRAVSKKYRYDNQVAVTATTGIAAAAIGGCTLHSWAGLGLAKQDFKELYKDLIEHKRKQDTIARWRNCRVLIIDEVSMMHGNFFEKLEEMGRAIREDERPFGGIQLVIASDFFQLPPVPETPSGHSMRQKEVQFVFETNAWKKSVPNIVTLTQVFRQRDATFVRLLNELRTGNASNEAIRTFKSLERSIDYPDGIAPTCLYAKRAQVLKENARRLAMIEQHNVAYLGDDRSGRAKLAPHAVIYPMEETLRAVLDRNTLVEYSMDLKVGAQVMLVKNLKTGGLVNGSIGHVLGFATAGQVKHAELSNAPGFKLDDLGVKQEKVEEEDIKPNVKLEGEETGGMNYTVRAKPEEITPEVADFVRGVTVAQEALSEREKRRRGYPPGEEPRDNDVPVHGMWPVVRFQNGSKMLLPPMDFSIENSEGVVEATRSQVPLILAWALSIHKSQGQTLERVKIDMGEIFEAGQAYVALSRATHMDTLQVLRFQPSKVKAHPKVVQWYNAIAEGRDV